MELQDERVEFAGNVTVLTDETLALMEPIPEDGTVLIFRCPTPELESLRAEDVIAGRIIEDVAPYGFLKRVIDVDFDSDQPAVIVEVREAELTEAIESVKIENEPIRLQQAGSLDSSARRLSGHAAPVSLQDDGPLTFTFENVVYEADGGQVEILSGGIGLAPDVRLTLIIDNAQVEVFALDFVVEEWFDAEVEAAFDTPLEERAEAQVLLAELTPVVFLVGDFPIVLQPEVRLNVGFEGEWEVGTQVGLSQASTISGGIAYEAGEWTGGGSEYRPQDHRFDVDISVSDTERSVFVGPQLLLSPYGIADTGPYVGLNAFSAWREVDGVVQRFNGLECEAGWEVGSFIAIPSYTHTLVEGEHNVTEEAVSD